MSTPPLSPSRNTSFSSESPQNSAGPQKETEAFLQAQETRQKWETCFDDAFAPFKNRMYYLYIDKQKWFGPDSDKKIKKICDCPEIGERFDFNEPGYQQGMETGFNYIRETLGQRFNINHFITLHDRCIDGVAVNRWKTKYFETGLCYGAAYEINPAIVSDQAKKEWASKKLIVPISSVDKAGYLTVLVAGKQVVSRFDPDDEDSIKRVNDAFNSYYIAIEKAQNLDGVLTAIVDLCELLEVDHIFSDGNQRSVAFCLLAKCLVENGLSPVILETPFMFDGIYSTSEMVKLLKKDLDFTRSFIDQQ